MAEARPSSAYVGEIDSLRCFAMTAVLLTHCGLLPFGWAGVWLFFVISGFVITQSMAAKAGAASKASSLGTFFLSRVRRIFPVYFVYLLLVGLVFSQRREDWLAALPWLATFSYNYGLIFIPALKAAPGAAHLWSLSVEQQFYLLFPFLFLFNSLQGLKRAMWTIIIASPFVRLAFGLYLKSKGMSDADAGYAVYCATLGQLDSFAAGSLLALAAREGKINAPALRKLALAAFGLGFLYFAVYLGANWLEHGAVDLRLVRNLVYGELYGDGREAVLYSMLTLVSVACIAATLVRWKPMMVLCAPKAFQKIGRISYGAYVYHGLVLYLASGFPAVLGSPSGGILQRLGFFAVVYAGTLAVAWLSFTFMETPIMHIGRRSRAQHAPEPAGSVS